MLISVYDHALALPRVTTVCSAYPQFRILQKRDRSFKVHVSVFQYGASQRVLNRAAALGVMQGPPEASEQALRCNCR